LPCRVSDVPFWWRCDEDDGWHAAIEIRRAVEAVYGYFLDLERNIVATDPTVVSIVKVTDGPSARARPSL